MPWISAYDGFWRKALDLRVWEPQGWGGGSGVGGTRHTGANVLGFRPRAVSPRRGSCGSFGPVGARGPYPPLPVPVSGPGGPFRILAF